MADSSKSHQQPDPLPALHAIELTASARPATRVVEAINERGETVPTSIAGEHALTLYLDRRELVTLMTLGAAPEELVLGYLRNQRLVAKPADIASVQVDWETGAAAVISTRLRTTGQTVWEPSADGSEPSQLADRLARRTVTTGCGQGTVFGDLMADVASLRLDDPGPGLDATTLSAVLEQVRRHESIYKVAGAVHGCALFSVDPTAPNNPPALLRFVEDVGRHNAVDAIAGWMWLHNVTGHDKMFYTTGRLTSEMVIKCAQMSIPILLSRSGLTEMGWQLANQFGMTMIGRCQGRHYLLFTGANRFRSDEPPHPPT